MDFLDLKRFLDKITDWRIPGADCAVYYRNKPVFRYSAGYADVKAKKPVSPECLYNMYSTSKVLTCAAALQLFERGEFLLTDPLWEYLPEFKDMMIKTMDEKGEARYIKAKKDITIRDLFAMTAGINYDLNSPSIQEVKKQTKGVCPTREAVKAIAKEPLSFEPGTHWQYSLCHDVLGGLIEVVSRKKFGDYMREYLFKPLGMKNTGFYQTEEVKKKMACQYRFDEEKKAAIEIPLDNSYQLGSGYESGGAGVISSVDDYIQFASAMCNEGKAPNGECILSSRTIDLMRINQLGEAAFQDFNWIQMVGYGYGLGVRAMMDKAKGGSLSPIGEFGWGGAAGAYVLIDPENELALFYAQHLLNNQEPYVHPRLRNILYRCLDQ